MRTTERQKLIWESAEFNGSFLRDTLDSSTDSSTVVATARAVSVLITLRNAAYRRAVTPAEIQVAIDGFMVGARVDTVLNGMGAETYIELDN